MKHRWFFMLFAIGLAPGFYQLSHPGGLNLGPGNEMAMEARNLVEEGIYGNSFRSMKTGPTATNPPLYPLFLALNIYLFRTPVIIVTAILITNIIVNALAAALLPAVSAALWGTPAPGIAGAALMIFASQLIPSWDANYTQLGLILFCLLTMHLTAGREYTAWHGTLSGVALGILFLLSQVVLLVAMLWIAYLLWNRQTRLPEMLRFLIPLLLTALLVNVPWLMRNFAIWGEFVTRTNLGMTLHASNNDCAEPNIEQELESGCYGATHPEISVPEAALVKGLGEPAYDRLKRAEVMTWIKSHPSRFFRLTLARIIQFWFPVPHSPRHATYMIWIITVLSLPGFHIMLKQRIPAAVFVGAVFLIYPLPYYVVVSSVRYRVPILWLSSLTAGYFLTAVSLRMGLSVLSRSQRILQGFE
jgi:hypothetical protein